MIDAHGIARIVFLGDLFHARESHAPATLGALRAWRERRAALALLLVEGNHDASAGAPPADLRIECVGEPYLDGPFRLQPSPNAFHGPLRACRPPASAYLLAGRRESLRLPCYWLGRRWRAAAFGDFTGTFRISPMAGDRIYAVAEGRVIGIPGYARARATPPERRPQRRRGRTATQKKAPGCPGAAARFKPDDPIRIRRSPPCRNSGPHISSALFVATALVAPKP